MRELLREAAEAARRAVHALPHAEWGDHVGMGADGSPTSRVDQVAEAAIQETLRVREASLNFLSEESEYEDGGHRWTLVADPVDGTTNAIAGLPNYSVSLAVCEEDLQGAVSSVVLDMSTGWLYEAERGEGAWLNGNRIRVRSYAPDRSLFDIYLGGRAHATAYELARQCRRVRNLGAASLDMCLVATGSADLYYMRTTATNLELRITDVAASALLVREAGGEVYGLEGNPLNMPLDPTHRSNLFALGDPSLLEVVL